MLLEHGFQEMKDKHGQVIVRYKSCIDQFPYTVEQNGKKVTVHLSEKRLLTDNPTLAAKKRYEILRMVEKAKALTVSHAKQNEYGELGKYILFTDEDGEKAKVQLNEAAIEKDLRYAGYNLMVTSELKMSDYDIYTTYHNLWRIRSEERRGGKECRYTWWAGH